MTRVAVIGSTGQLWTDLVRTLREAEDYQVIPLSHAEIECTEPGSVSEALRRTRADIVVNCAAFVRVDESEERPEEAFRVNALGALYVARACAEIGALCVYVSTDYVFEGGNGEPYTEDDQPRPVNIYGASKLAGEYLVQQACPRWLIVRTSSLFGISGARGKGGNFVEAILAKARAGEALKVVCDSRMSPTYTRDAARELERLLRQKAAGFYHLVNAGACTWYEFARETLNLAGLDCEVKSISVEDYPQKASRPTDSSLTCLRLEGFLQTRMRSWQEALRAYLIDKRYIAA